MSKPESETDPWAKVRTFDVSTYGDCRMERDYYGEIASEQKYQRGEYAWVDEVDAARAAEAAQHRQEIAAKDETIGRWTQTGLTLMKFFAAFPVMNESDMPEFLWREVPTLIRSTRQAAAKAEARLAAVEAERDHEQNKADVRGNMLRYIAFVTTGDENGDGQLGVDRLTAERDRLKVALQDVTIGMDRAGGDRDGMPECPWCQSQGRPEDAEEGYAHDVDCSLMMARAALTPQGQFTDGETR